MSCRINRKSQATQAKLGATNLTSLFESDKKVTEGSSNRVQVLPPPFQMRHARFQVVQFPTHHQSDAVNSNSQKVPNMRYKQLYREFKRKMHLLFLLQQLHDTGEIKAVSQLEDCRTDQASVFLLSWK